MHNNQTSSSVHNEAKKKKKKNPGNPEGLWGAIRKRRKAGKRRLRPGEKGYPKTLDIGEALLREAIREILINEEE